MSNQFLNSAESLRTAVKYMLLNEWDPIGVKHIPEAKDEYNGYAPKICDLLIQQKAKQEIFDYLWWIETEHMGLMGNRHATDAFVDKLLALVDL